MVGIIKNRLKNRWIFLFFLTNLLALLTHFRTNAQEMPPRPIGVYIMQNLSFGAFYQGLTGGTVIIYPSGIRYATGDIILVGLGYLYFPAIFELEGNPGSIVHFLGGPDATLTGTNGGSLTLHVGDTDAGDPIIINVAPPGRMQIRVGGILIVSNPLANPTGSYTGSFMVMFIQE
jgi:Domain of unknown function (DUF4402)